MRFSRIIVESEGVSRRFAFEPDISVIDVSSADAERIASVVRNLFLGIKRNCQIFATIDGVEFEITDEMVPLIGQRFASTFQILDTATPPKLSATATEWPDVQASAIRAALETTDAILPTLDVDRLDRALAAVDHHREPLAANAHRQHLKRSGLMQLFSRRNGRHLLDPSDPAVHQLARLDSVLTDRRRQVSTGTSPFPDEYARASLALRDLLSTTLGEAANGDQRAIASMSAESVAATGRAWLNAHHERQVTPGIKAQLNAHASGVDVLGAIPAVIDLRNVEGRPPAADMLRTAVANHRRRLQFIMLPGDEGSQRWLDDLSSPASMN